MALVFPGIALVLLALRGRRAGPASLIGLVAGLAFYLTHIEWASLYLGPVPWIALSALESLFVAAGAAVIATAYRWIPRAFPTVAGRVVLLPVAVAGLWTAREAISAVWPYGGFAWGGWRCPSPRARSRTSSPGSACPACPSCSCSSWPCCSSWRPRSACAARPARSWRGSRSRWCSSSPPSPWRPRGPPGSPPCRGTRRPATSTARATATSCARTSRRRRRSRPTRAWTWSSGPRMRPTRIRSGTRGRPRRSTAWWRGSARRSSWAPSRSATAASTTSRSCGPGTGDRPLRQEAPGPVRRVRPRPRVLGAVRPDLIGLIQREYTPGTTDQVMDVAGVTAGIAICFDIVDDQLTTDMVHEGAGLILAQSNNADFGRTDESVQQLAIARMRALETGRSVVNISTVGTSAIVGPDGRDLDRLPWFTAGSMVVDVPTADVVTPAILVGRDIEWFVSGLGLGALAVAGLALGRRGRRAAC
ncbi:nitrilase-related carbon-nitrogen hydrolase [Clavibacter tessellarius]